MPMRRRLILLACLVLAPATRAQAEGDDAFLDLSGARMLASPGVPEGLHPFLPGGEVPERLSWPLPEGPLLVLGLPGRDDAARDLAFFWDLLAPGQDLHGGYLVAAWHDGNRPIAVILGDDAAALYAARFELESAPVRQGMTVLDFSKPPAEVGLRIRRGHRVFRPRFRIRAYSPRHVSPASAVAAIASHANRIWLPYREIDQAPTLLPHLLRHGVAPCVVLSVQGDDTPEELARRAVHWFRLGVRHVVLQGLATHAHVRHLRSRWKLEEVVFHHRSHRLLGTLGTWDPQLWCGDPIPEQVLREGAPKGPVLFVDRWALVNQTPVPSRPRNRPPELGRMVDGVVVLGGPGALEVLEDAWAPATGTACEWETVLLPLLPRGLSEPRAFLDRTAARLAAFDGAARRAVDWLDPLLGRVRSSLGELHDRAALVPRVTTPIHLDGALDEPAWGYARALVFPLPRDAHGRSGTLLAVSDGCDLHISLRLSVDALPQTLYLSPLAHEFMRVAGIGEEAASDEGTWRHAEAVRTWEGTLGHFVLSGDAHPTRVLHLWHNPDKGVPQRLGSLVLGP